MIDATEGGEGGGGKGLTDEEIVVHSIVFLLAGYETTSNTLAYISYLLALNPEIQEKLQTTIDEYFENNPVSGGATSDMIIDMLTNHAPTSEVYCHKMKHPPSSPLTPSLSPSSPPQLLSGCPHVRCHTGAALPGHGGSGVPQGVPTSTTVLSPPLAHPHLSILPLHSSSPFAQHKHIP